VRLQGLGQLKNPMASSGIEPTTTRITSGYLLGVHVWQSEIEIAIEAIYLFPEIFVSNSDLKRLQMSYYRSQESCTYKHCCFMGESGCIVVNIPIGGSTWRPATFTEGFHVLSST
jgi:hypothetical protein